MLCIQCEITGSLSFIFLKFGRRILLKVLRSDENAKVCIPCEEDVSLFQQTFGEKHSMLHIVLSCRWVEALHKAFRRLCDTNMFYNGWTHDHYV